MKGPCFGSNEIDEQTCFLFSPEAHRATSFSGCCGYGVKSTVATEIPANITETQPYVAGCFWTDPHLCFQLSS